MLWLNVNRHLDACSMANSRVGIKVMALCKNAGRTKLTRTVLNHKSMAFLIQRHSYACVNGC